MGGVKKLIVPFFSLVMPAYNCENTIGATIDSILAQTFSDFELIIINDGSTDQTEKVIETYQRTDERIQFHTIPNGGPGNARNVGITSTKGTYLFLVDADDSLDVNNLEIRFQHLEKYEPDLLIGSYQTNVLDDETIVDQKWTKAPDLLLHTKKEFLDQVYPLMEQQLMYVIWNKVYRLDIIKENHITFPPYNSCEDRLFNLHYFQYVEKCVLTSEILYHYAFDGKNSLTNKFFPNKFQTFEEFYLVALELVPKDEAGFSALFLKGTMSCFIPLHSPSCPLSFKQKRAYIKEVLQNKRIHKAAQISVTNSIFKKIMKLLFSIPIVGLHYFVSWLLYKISMLNPKTIEKLKGNF